MDWQLKPASRKSALTGEPFKPGDRVISLIYKEEKELQRADILESEEEKFPTPAALLAKWGHTVRAPDEEKKFAQQNALTTAEDLFLSLYTEDSGEPIPERQALKQILALYLERKRIIKRLGTLENGNQEYLHTASKKTYPVPMDDFDLNLIAEINQQLEQLVF